MNVARIAGMVALALVPGVAGAQFILDPVPGTMTLSSATYSRRTGAGVESATPCYGGGAGGPFVVFGTNQLGGANTWGTIEGEATPLVTLDGVSFSNPRLLPAGSFFRSGLGAIGTFCPGATSHPEDCPGLPCALTYDIGNGTVQGSTPNDFEVNVDIPASGYATSIPFRFVFCNRLVVWGAGCGIVGSGAYRWRLFAPARPSVVQTPAGGTGPFAFGSTGARLTFSSDPGGITTVTNVPGFPSTIPPPASSAIPRYWDARTDMSTGSFACDITIRFDPLEIPATVSEAGLKLLAWDDALSEWGEIETQVDVTQHEVSAAGLTRLTTFMIGTPLPTPAHGTSWGRIKRRFR